MAIADDFTIDYVYKRIYHSSGTTVYSVNALYSYLMNTFDEPEQMDDTVPMSAQTPTDYTFINSWFMDDNSYRFLKGGAIQTNGYASNIHVLSFASSTFVAGDIGFTIQDDGVDFGTILSVNAAGTKVWVRTGSATVAAQGSVMTGNAHTGTTTTTYTTGEDLFPNVYTLGSIEEDDDQQIYIIQNGISLSEWWPDAGAAPPTRHIDVLIKTKEQGVEIDDGKITVFLRHYPSDGLADLYDHFDIDLSGGGRNAVPLATSPDLNNTSSHAIVSGYNDITIAWVNGTITHGAVTNGPFENFETVTGGASGATAVVLLDDTGVMTLGNIIIGSTAFQNGEVLTGSSSGATTTTSSTVTAAYTMEKNFIKQAPNDYSVIIDCNGHRLSEVYEYMKYVLRENSSFDTYGMMTASATLSQNILDGEQYIRAYNDYDTPANSYSPVKAAPFGTFAGGKLFGARGVWVENMHPDDILQYQLIDSGNTTRTPPTQATITVTNLIASDRVAVFRTTAGTTINKAMYAAAAGNNSGATTFVVGSAITNDTPTAGTIRIIDDSDTGATRERRHTYSSWDGVTFSGLSPALDRNYTAVDDKVYIPFIDEVASDTSASVTVIYVSDRSILVRVRRYTATAILPFETTGTFGSNGFSIATIRTTDTIVS
jgi:hypothetical protein